MEDTIGYLPYIHPDATLRSELREELEGYIKDVELKSEEIIDLTMGNPEAIDPDTRTTVSYPAFDVFKGNAGFGNGEIRINTRILEIRCDPSDASILKKIQPYVNSEQISHNFHPNGPHPGLWHRNI